MPSSDAQKKAVKEYQKKRDAIMLRPPKSEGEIIRAAAAATGESVQGYILHAVREQLFADAAGQYLVRISKEDAEAYAKANNQTLEEWLSDHQATQE